MGKRAQLIDLVAKDELEKIFKQINEADFFSKKEYKKLVALSGRFHSLKKERNGNVISVDTYQIESSRIREAIIDVLSTEKQAVISINKKRSFPWLIPVLIVAISALAWWALNPSNKTNPSLPSTIVTSPDPVSTVEEKQAEEIQPVTNTIDKKLTKNDHQSEPNKEHEEAKKNNEEQYATPVTKEVSPQTEEKSNEITKKKALEIDSRKITLKLSTNLGDENITVKSNQEMRLFVEVNKPCYIRIIYKLVTGEMVLLDDGRQLKNDEVGKKIEIGDGFEPDEPFGEETLYALASTSTFDKLETKEKDGYTFITSSLDKAIAISKGLKKSRHIAEVQLQVLTVE